MSLPVDIFTLSEWVVSLGNESWNSQYDLPADQLKSPNAIFIMFFMDKWMLWCHLQFLWQHN